MAKTLHKRGRIFLVDAFHGHQELADSINHLLVVGFYLINVGYVAFALKSTPNPRKTRKSRKKPWRGRHAAPTTFLDFLDSPDS